MRDAVAAQTIYFERCAGVFQGGGCRAIALAGAYEAAFHAGIRFTRVAGTSAGSIVAVLIGAGASSEFIRTEIAKLDFKKFLKPPEGQVAHSNWKAKAAQWVLGMALPKDKAAYLNIAQDLLTFGGLYSSEEIGTWVDELLARLLPDAKRPIQFESLKLPTYVVATNLLSAVPQVWSKKKSPDAYVGLAVRASCSIPGFFQPIVDGENRYVDGGVVSNLPGFVFVGDGEDESDLILAVGLKGNYVAPGRWTPEQLLQRVINASIDGASDIQRRLISQRLYVVEVQTDDVLATDFERMAESGKELIPKLLQNGKEAVEAFVRDEPNRVSVRQPSARVCSDIDETFCAIVERSRSPVQQVIVAQPNTDWAWKIVPTLLGWSHSGAAIRVYVEAQNQSSPEENARRRLLEALGVEVVAKEMLPFAGFLFDSVDPGLASAVVYLGPSARAAGFATVYAGGALHYPVIQALVQSLEAGPMGQGNLQQCKLLNSPDIEILKSSLRKGVRQYSDPDVTFHLEKVSIKSIKLLYHSVRKFKCIQARRLIVVFEKRGLQLFSPARVDIGNGNFSIVTPPVIEDSGKQCVAITGCARLFTCFERQPDAEVTCVVVRGVTEPLPGRPIKIQEAGMVHRTMPPKDRVLDFDYNHFRRIEQAAHPV
jgi:predicted acylesterase/phospholipase RssA